MGNKPTVQVLNYQDVDSLPPPVWTRVYQLIPFPALGRYVNRVKLSALVVSYHFLSYSGIYAPHFAPFFLGRLFSTPPVSHRRSLRLCLSILKRPLSPRI
jgi:hypothetical protein